MEENGKDPDQNYKPLGEMVKTKKISNTRKRQVVTPEGFSQAAEYSLSNRQVFEMVDAVISEDNLEDQILSVSAGCRKWVEFSAEAEKKLIANKLAAGTNFYTLLGDGKVFRALTHCSGKEKPVAVLLTTSEEEKILLGITPIEYGSAPEEYFKILNLLIDKGIDLNKIIACVFDTNTVNTGEKNGIVKAWKLPLSRALLELARRHHV